MGNHAAAAVLLILGLGGAAGATAPRELNCSSLAQSYQGDPPQEFYGYCATQIMSCAGLDGASCARALQQGGYVFVRDLGRGARGPSAIEVLSDGSLERGQTSEFPLGSARIRSEFNDNIELIVQASPSRQIDLWGLTAVGVNDQSGRRRTELRGRGIRVAVVDTGIDCDHPAFGRLPLRHDACVASVDITRTRGPRVDDNGHGTHVAGTIAGAEFSLAGIDPYPAVGVAPEADLISVKVMNAQGQGNNAQIVAGIYWAIAAGANVINLSLGSPSHSPAICDAVAAASGAGIIVVAASGNEGPRVPVGSPADCDLYTRGPETVSSVAATDQRGAITDFSSLFDLAGNGAINFTAPGKDIWSAAAGGVGFRALSGTSMAAPHVSGVAAIYRQAGYLPSAFKALGRPPRALVVP